MKLDVSTLNAQQYEAVTSTEGPLLVLAGAGSGKTRVITTRIAYLITQKNVLAGSILAVTFTNKAAREMDSRVRSMLPRSKGKKSGKPLISTFHSLGVRLLRQYIHLLGFPPSFVIYDDQDQQGVIKDILEDGDYDLGVYPHKQVHFALQQAKGKGLQPADLNNPNSPPDQQIVGAVWEVYQDTMRRMGAIDFEDILRLSQRVCAEHGSEVSPFLAQFRYVMVDEYQDTNRTQYDLLRHFTKGHGNLCVVGDDDQSIYGWRGAEPGNILDFERDFPGTKVVHLEENYRSTDTILSAANQVISQNPVRKAKTLRGNLGRGEPLMWLEAKDEREEMEKVAIQLRRIKMATGAPLSEFAILYRSNHQSRGFEEILREEGLPYTLVGGTRFYDRKEIKDALSYLRIIQNHADEVALNRIINFPRRGIGKTSQLKLIEYGRHQNRPAFEVMLEATVFQDFTPAVATSIERLAELILRYKKRFDEAPLNIVFRELMGELAFHNAVEADKKDPKSRERASGLIYELERGVDYYAEKRPEAGLSKYMEHITLLTLPEDPDSASKTPMITLMTVHSAKGLEFPYVFLVQMADDLFPHTRSIAEGSLEEERRLFYVAITRAKKLLIFSMAKERKRFGTLVAQKPSRFLEEVDQGLFDGISPGGGPPSKEVKDRLAGEAKKRFFDQMQKMRKQTDDSPS